MQGLKTFRRPITGTSPENLYQCLTPVCDYIYDPELGDQKARIPPGTRFEELPPDWCCPFCGADKQAFRRLREPRGQESRELGLVSATAW